MNVRKRKWNLNFYFLLFQSFTYLIFIIPLHLVPPLLIPPHKNSCSFSNLSSLHLRYTHSPILPSLYLRYISFFNPSVASPTSHLILQPFFRFSYVTGSSPREPLMRETNPDSISSMTKPKWSVCDANLGSQQWEVGV